MRKQEYGRTDAIYTCQAVISFAQFLHTALLLPIYLCFKFQVNSFISFKVVLQTKIDYKIQEGEITQKWDKIGLCFLGNALPLSLSTCNYV